MNKYHLLFLASDTHELSFADRRSQLHVCRAGRSVEKLLEILYGLKTDTDTGIDCISPWRKGLL